MAAGIGNRSSRATGRGDCAPTSVAKGRTVKSSTMAAARSGATSRATKGKSAMRSTPQDNYSNIGILTIAMSMVACGDPAPKAPDGASDDGQTSSNSSTDGAGSTTGAGSTHGVNGGQSSTSATTGGTTRGATTGAGTTEGGAGPDETATNTTGGVFVPPTCSDDPALPETAPHLVQGEWFNISPPGIAFDANASAVTQGMAMDPCNPATVYVCIIDRIDRASTGKTGVYRTLDGGGSWTRLGPMSNPVKIKVDPGDPKHLYVADGVTGSTHGFWRSFDGGENWEMPPAFD